MYTKLQVSMPTIAPCYSPSTPRTVLPDTGVPTIDATSVLLTVQVVVIRFPVSTPKQPCLHALRPGTHLLKSAPRQCVIFFRSCPVMSQVSWTLLSLHMHLCTPAMLAFTPCVSSFLALGYQPSYRP